MGNYHDYHDYHDYHESHDYHHNDYIESHYDDDHEDQHNRYNFHIDYDDDNYLDDYDDYHCEHISRASLRAHSRFTSERSQLVELCAMCSWLPMVAVQYESKNLHMFY